MIRVKLAAIAIMTVYSTLPVHANLQYHDEELSFAKVNTEQEVKMAFAQGRKIDATYSTGILVSPEKNIIQYYS